MARETKQKSGASSSNTIKPRYPRTEEKGGGGGGGIKNRGNNSARATAPCCCCCFLFFPSFFLPFGPPPLFILAATTPSGGFRVLERREREREKKREKERDRETRFGKLKVTNEARGMLVLGCSLPLVRSIRRFATTLSNFVPRRALDTRARVYRVSSRVCLRCCPLLRVCLPSLDSSRLVARP